MNISKPLALCLLATVWAFAQAPAVQVAPPQVQVQAPAPTRVQVAPPPQVQVQTPAPTQVQVVPPAPTQVQVVPPQVQVQTPAPAAQAPAIQFVPPQAPVQQAPAQVAVEPTAQAPLEGASSPDSRLEAFLSTQQSPSPMAETKPAEKSIFDSVRGNAYNPFGTVGAASTVGDLVTTPSDISGNKFLYVSPIDQVGYTSFGFVGGSLMLGLDNSTSENGNNLAALILGYANSGFGLAIKYSVDKIFLSDERSGNNLSTRITYPADNIELYLSFPIGAETLYANGGWITDRESGSVDNDGKTRKIDFSTMTANVGLLGSNYNIHLNLARQGGFYVNEKDKKAVEEGTFSAFALGIDLGFEVLQSKTARVIIGLNDTVGVAFFDKIGKLYKGDNIIIAQLTPNILGEVALSQNLFAFAGAAHNLTIISGDGDAEADTHLTMIESDPETQAFMGIRYQKPNWAIESQLSTNPFGALAGENILFNLGGFIYF